MGNIVNLRFSFWKSKIPLFAFQLRLLETINLKQKKATATSDSPIIVKCSHSNKCRNLGESFPKLFKCGNTF